MQRGCLISIYGFRYFCKIKKSVSEFKKSLVLLILKGNMVMKLNISFWITLIWNDFNIFRNSSSSSSLWLNLLLLLLWISPEGVLDHPALDNLCLKHVASTEDNCSSLLYLAYPKVLLFAQPLQVQRSRLMPQSFIVFLLCNKHLISIDLHF